MESLARPAHLLPTPAFLFHPIAGVTKLATLKHASFSVTLVSTGLAP
jgi:hypothetical protein